MVVRAGMGSSPHGVGRDGRWSHDVGFPPAAKTGLARAGHGGGAFPEVAKTVRAAGGSVPRRKVAAPPSGAATPVQSHATLPAADLERRAGSAGLVPIANQRPASARKPASLTPPNAPTAASGASAALAKQAPAAEAASGGVQAAQARPPAGHRVPQRPQSACGTRGRPVHRGIVLEEALADCGLVTAAIVGHDDSGVTPAAPVASAPTPMVRLKKGIAGQPCGPQQQGGPGAVTAPATPQQSQTELRRGMDCAPRPPSTARPRSAPRVRSYPVKQPVNASAPCTPSTSVGSDVCSVDSAASTSVPRYGSKADLDEQLETPPEIAVPMQPCRSNRRPLDPNWWFPSTLPPPKQPAPRRTDRSVSPPPPVPKQQRRGVESSLLVPSAAVPQKPVSWRPPGSISYAFPPKEKKSHEERRTNETSSELLSQVPSRAPSVAPSRQTSFAPSRAESPAPDIDRIRRAKIKPAEVNPTGAAYPEVHLQLPFEYDASDPRGDHIEETSVIAFPEFLESIHALHGLEACRRVLGA